MARNIKQRLTQLDARRRGLDRIGRVGATEQLEVIAKSFLEESYAKRATTPYTRYALGAMQEVGPEYTRISIKEAERVGAQLNGALTALGITVDFRLQGSVPCNIHIRGVSDVDLLILDDRFFTYEKHGQRSQAGHFNNPVSYTPLSALQTLRRHTEAILKEKFPAAEVDLSGSKAVNISGGSLRRPVDVVPSHWHDTADYQATSQEADRGIYVLDKKAETCLLNMPFRHIQRLGERDELSRAGLKKAIRLCKHVKSDAEGEGTMVNLPSFDIAAAMWHADLDALRVGAINELAILAETQRHFDALARNHSAAKQLLVPDGSRPIFNTDEKLMGLNQLSYELDDLAKEVSAEQSRYVLLPPQTWSDISETLRKARVPMM